MLFPSIHFHSEDVSFRLKNVKATRLWIANCARIHQHTVGTLNYILCSDDYLLDLNLRYLNHDTYTDIITFDYSEQSTISGDIFISIDRIKNNASVLNTGLYNELHRVMIHGMLHLCGYKDKSTVEKTEMTEKEDYCLTLRDF